MRLSPSSASAAGAAGVGGAFGERRLGGAAGGGDMGVDRALRRRGLVRLGGARPRQGRARLEQEIGAVERAAAAATGGARSGRSRDAAPTARNGSSAKRGGAPGAGGAARRGGSRARRRRRALRRRGRSRPRAGRAGRPCARESPGRWRGATGCACRNPPARRAIRRSRRRGRRPARGACIARRVASSSSTRSATRCSSAAPGPAVCKRVEAVVDVGDLPGQRLGVDAGAGAAAPIEPFGEQVGDLLDELDVEMLRRGPLSSRSRSVCSASSSARVSSFWPTRWSMCWPRSRIIAARSAGAARRGRASG